MNGAAEAEHVVENDRQFSLLATQVGEAALEDTGVAESTPAACVSIRVEVDVEPLPSTVDEGI